jgi:transposase
MANSKAKKKSKSESSILKTTAEEIKELRLVIAHSDFNERQKEILITMIDEIVAMKSTEEKKLTQLARMRRAMSGSSEKKDNNKDQSNSKNNSNTNKENTDKKNHGRLSADDYKPSDVFQHKHTNLEVGCTCPECDHGTLQQIKPARAIKIIGTAPIQAHLHESEKLRCSGCGNIFTAPLPEEVCEEKADPSASAIIAMFRYGMGVPHYRLASIQKAVGVPLPVSTQYEMVEMLWTAVTPVFQKLLKEAANAQIIFADDTPSKVLELMINKEALKNAGERVGIYTTAIVAEKDDKQIHLFFTGRKHAGENLGKLLKIRCSDNSPPIQMTDAAPCNFKNDAMTIASLCLVHGRRNFVDCEESFPDEADFVIQKIGMVYKNEKHIKSVKMNDQDRLAYHQAHSQKPMDEIKQFIETGFAEKKVEPNSSLGAAFKYMLKHWEGLTRFLTTPGAPVDNNRAERLVKKFIMYKKNSYFYKNENGAKVGDCLMSIIQTCLSADEFPIDYLTVIQKNKRAVAKHPELWLPWNYKKMLKSVQSEA